MQAQADVGGHKLLKIHEDLDLPGTHSKRPGLQAAMERVEAGKVDGIIVAKLDRFGRSAIDIHRNLERIRGAGGELLSAAEGIDTSTAIGRFFLAIAAAFAELEIERIGENWEAARIQAVERGVHISGQPPTGYRRREDGRLEPEPSIAQYVTEAFARAAVGEPWKAIADWLGEEEVPTLRGAPLWTVSTVRTMIRNRVYLGEARSGDLAKVGAHPPLVDPEIWEAANRKRAAKMSATGNAAGMLSGILRCAGCSFALKPSMGRTRHGKLRREYRCRPDKAAGRCPAPASVSAEPVETAVVERFFATYDDLFGRFHKRTDEREEVERRLTQGRAELSAALDERLVEALGGEDSETYIATVRRRREAIEADEGLLDSLDDDSPDLPHPQGIKDIWDELQMVQRRALLGSAYESIFLRRARSPREPAGDRLRFFAAGTSPPLPVRGKRGTIRSVEVD